ncbi:MAG: chromate transporter [Rikenellaceae bacterium]|nr:chromate transporter [Rikenellaceae bacterium]
MRKFVELFLSFLKIGLFTFGGGYAMIPVIEREVVTRHHWVEERDFFDLLTLAQSAPGPISLNASVFVGYKMYGYWGALAALLGVALPSFLIILIVAIFFSQIRENPIVDAAFKGMRPVVVALMFAPVVGLAKGMKWWAMAVAAAVATAVWYFGFSPIYLLIVAAVAGLLWAARKGKEVKR